MAKDYKESTICVYVDNQAKGFKKMSKFDLNNSRVAMSKTQKAIYPSPPPPPFTLQSIILNPPFPFSFRLRKIMFMPHSGKTLDF